MPTKKAKVKDRKPFGLRKTKVYKLDAKRWDELMKALENPPTDNPGLRRLLAHKPVWEK